MGVFLAIPLAWELMLYTNCNFYYILQIGDLKGFFGLFMVNMQLLREKLRVLDMSYGMGTGMKIYA